MIRNALVTSYRTIVNNKTYTIINIAGLVLGLTAAFVLIVFAINETSYNSCFPKNKQLYRAIFTDSKGVMLPSGSRFVKSLLINHIPECKSIARVVYDQFMPAKIKVTGGSKIYECSNFICADPEIFDMLDIRFSWGGSKLGIEKPNRLFISEIAMKKYFNGELKLFQTIRLVVGKFQYDMTLAGIYNELPWNSTLNPDFIAGLPFYEKMLNDAMPGLLPHLPRTELGVQELFDKRGLGTLLANVAAAALERLP